MINPKISRATLGRAPAYLKFLRGIEDSTANISATTIAKELELGEVQVRKDLRALCGSGKPKTGYKVGELTAGAVHFHGGGDCGGFNALLCGLRLKINRGKDGFGNYHRYCRRKVHFAAGDDRKHRKSISRRNE